MTLMTLTYLMFGMLAALAGAFGYVLGRYNILCKHLWTDVTIQEFGASGSPSTYLTAKVERCLNCQRLRAT